MHENSIDGLSCNPVTALLVKVHLYGDSSAVSITASSTSQGGNGQKSEAAHKSWKPVQSARSEPPTNYNLEILSRSKQSGYMETSYRATRANKSLFM